ncbi:hypothetical protein LMG24238_02118 [Paraburkholderia sediminicola]|uniref:Uncharacterized protein n=1 Tax=Paraburkholderia sediminicola TaxID=458836 RepID=A0A6J5AQW5_9BURK|nr:hypothetical protein LMG24238_02118 [Paraburkholderia sediminicola]
MMREKFWDVNRKRLNRMRFIWGLNEDPAIAAGEGPAIRGISPHRLAGPDYVTITASSRTKSRTTEPESGVLSMSSFASISLARSAMP